MKFEKLQMIIAEVLSVDPEGICVEMSFTDDLGADSLEIFQILMGVEEEFDIIIEEDDAGKIQTVEDLFSLISA